MNRKPRLLIFENNPAYFLSHRLHLAHAFTSSGYEVHVATMPGPGTKEIKTAGFMHHPVRFSRSGINPLAELMVLFRVIRLYSKLKPDFVYQITIKPVNYGTIAARWTRVKAVISVISGLGFVATGNSRMILCLRPFIFLLYRFSLRHHNQRIIFQNRDDLELFVNHKIVKHHETAVIPGSGVDTGYFTLTQEAAVVPTVVLPGRMLRDKGVYEYVAAAAILHSQGIRARFLLAGGIDRENPGAIPETQLQQWNSEGNVEWLGQVTDMRIMYSKSHIVCLPSYREGVPRALLEAAASGRPVVSTDVPGCREAVVDGETGLLVPARNAVLLAGALKRLITDAALRRQMGKQGRLLAERRFSTTRVIAETMEIVKQLI